MLLIRWQDSVTPTENQCNLSTYLQQVQEENRVELANAS